MEKDYTYQSIIASVVIHCLLLLVCLLFILRTPIPPYGAGMGVELNYGTVSEGYGDIQTLNKANKSPVREEAAPAKEEKKEEKVVEKQVVKEEIKEPVPVKPEKVIEEKVITTLDDESKTYVKKTEEKTTKPVTPPVTPQKKPEVDNRAVYGTSSSSNGTSGNKEQIAGNNNGDRPGKVGDQGDTRGTVEGKALYGNPGTGGDGPGGSGGSRLDLAGWTWDSKPVVKDESDESGKIVFEIKVDNNGDLINARVIESTVSPSVVQYYQKEIRKLTFTKTSSGAAPTTSVGRITILIKTR